ncbi:MAG TPA: MEDS domain-containing protein [Micromonosporaceae bacterium]|nr:MEDS domain-containing protein [Micromonosporaceae bacterium]
MTTSTSVEDLSPGDHACLTFSDKEERLDIIAAFIRDGLGQGHKVVCFTESVPPDRLATELLEREVATDEPLRRGQLTVQTCDEAWLSGGPLTAARMIDVLGGQLDLASREGYPGLRVTADMCWATRPIAAVEQLVVFEAEVSRLFTDGRLTAICQYDRHSFDAVTLAFAAAAHPRAVAATVYHEDPVLRVCRQHSPAGVRIAGEIDYTRLDVLAHALSEALRLDHHPYLNLAQLRFIDAATASAMVQAGLSLPAGRRMAIACRGLVHKIVELVGGTDLPQIRVVVADGEP